MADILEYFDSINIDVAKRKYYNVNKVNAVLEELRIQAKELVEENERQRMELEALRAERTQKQTDTMNSRELLLKLQRVYRETLEKAHNRADDVVREAEEKSAALLGETEKKKGLAAEQVKACFMELQSREEDHIRLLNSSLQQILECLDTEKVAPKNTRDQTDPDKLLQKCISTDSRSLFRGSVPSEDYEEDSTYGAGREQLKDLELQIQRLAKEISALESGI